MDFLLSILFSLLTFFSFNLVPSFASPPSYKEHCSSTVPDSTPTTRLNHNAFPLGDHHTGFYTGGDSIIDVGASWNRFSFHLSKRRTHATQTPNLFKLEGTVSFRSSNMFSDGSYYGGQRRYRKGYVSFKLEGFWHEPSGKVCMVGIGSGYSKQGDSLHVNAVFKLNDVFNESNITSLVSGSLENLSSEKGDNYFEPISVLMLPNEKYNYTMDSVEVVNEFSDGSDPEQGLALNLDSLSFCKFPLSWELRGLQLEYSHECHASKNCSISGSSGKLPSLMSLTSMGCSLTTKKHRLRVLVEFQDVSYFAINKSFDPKTMLVGEGWWDEKNNMLCVVACHIMGKSSASLAGTHVGDCSVRLRLRFPSIWSIKNTSSIVGQIWSNKSASDSGYFKMATFRNDEDLGVGVHGLKYEFSQLERVNKSCPSPKHKPNDKGKRYPEAYSYNMRFDMSLKESMKRVAWGYSQPIAIDDEISEFAQYRSSGFIQSFSDEVPDGTTFDTNNGTSNLFNMSYKISLSVLSLSKSADKYSVFNLSSGRVKITAEGVYDAAAGTLCMVGCRDLIPKNETPVAHSADCEILLNIQFPPLDSSSYIKGSIESRRKKSDPLYFNPLDLSAVSFYREAARRNIWRTDMEVIMALISTTLACVFVGLQLYKVKREPNVLPFISLIMMSILTLGHMVPLVLNFEALLSQNPNNKMWVFNNAWLEVNEISVRLVTMVAFLLQFRLLYLTWSARKSGESKNGQWSAERNSAYVTLVLYAAGLLVAFLLKLMKKGDKDSVYIPVYNQPSSWENIKSYGGLVLDGFLLPQIILNLFSNMRDNVLSCSFYFGTTFVRLLPHAYDLYRTRRDAPLDNGLYYYADPSEDFYSTAWDIAIPLGGIIFAIIIYLQQRFGAHYILPQRFKVSKVYEKVPVVTDSETELETTNK